MMRNGIERLQALVEAERDALLAGDFGKLGELFAEKETLAPQLATEHSSHEDLAILREQMKRNQVLFDRALSGLRAVAGRLDLLSEVRKSLATYDATGRRQDITAARAKNLERRA